MIFQKKAKKHITKGIFFTKNSVYSKISKTIKKGMNNLQRIKSLRISSDSFCPY